MEEQQSIQRNLLEPPSSNPTIADFTTSDGSGTGAL